jgi:hypothetical protein
MIRDQSETGKHQKSLKFELMDLDHQGMEESELEEKKEVSESTKSESNDGDNGEIVRPTDSRLISERLVEGLPTPDIAEDLISKE